jgi:hypothetical protein
MVDLTVRIQGCGAPYGGRTALLLAVEKDNAHLVATLLSAGANVFAKDDVRGRYWESAALSRKCSTSSPAPLALHQSGFSPLYLATARGCVSTVSAILKHMGDRDAIDHVALPAEVSPADTVRSRVLRDTLIAYMIRKPYLPPLVTCTAAAIKSAVHGPLFDAL